MEVGPVYLLGAASDEHAPLYGRGTLSAGGVTFARPGGFNNSLSATSRPTNTRAATRRSSSADDEQRAADGRPNGAHLTAFKAMSPAPASAGTIRVTVFTCTSACRGEGGRRHSSASSSKEYSRFVVLLKPAAADHFRFPSTLMHNAFIVQVFKVCIDLSLLHFAVMLVADTRR